MKQYNGKSNTFEESKGQLEQMLQKVSEDFFLMATCSIVYLRKKCLIIAPFFNYVRNYFSLPGILHTPWCEKLWHFYTCCSLFTRTWKNCFLNWFLINYKWPDSMLTTETYNNMDRYNLMDTKYHQMAFPSLSDGAPNSSYQWSFRTPGQTKLKGDHQRETIHDFCCLSAE